MLLILKGLILSDRLQNLYNIFMLMLKRCGLLKLVMSTPLRSSQALRQSGRCVTFRNVYYVKNMKDGNSRDPERGEFELPKTRSISHQEIEESFTLNSTVQMHNQLEYEQKLYFCFAFSLLMAFNIIARLTLKSSKSESQHSKFK